MNRITPLLACIGIIILLFMAVSLLDIVLATISSRFYSNAAFVVIFGVGGIFAAALGYTTPISMSKYKDETARWSLIVTLMVTGFAFYFPLAKLEGGEYEAAFKAYGITMALGSLLFVSNRVE